VPRVKSVFDCSSGGHGDVIRPDAVEPPCQILPHLRLGDEAGHLPQRMHPRIGPPSHRELHGLAQDSGQCRLKLPLHGSQARLRRPSLEPGPVIFKL
jgi:hypothetical protein